MAYRHRKATKRVGGKLKRYTNLAVFNRECTRGAGGNQCILDNIRCTKDGGGLATVSTISMRPKHFDASGKRIPDSRIKSKYPPSGTWLLHFASCTVMKTHLRKRVNWTRQDISLGRR